MGCATCGSSGGSPSGCGNKGHCASGGCNKMNTFDWLSEMDLHDPTEFDIVEVSFKQGARKDFFKNINGRVSTGDIVVVDANPGYDIGHVSLSGELVRLQIKKKRVPNDREFKNVIRLANDRDMEKLEEARAIEKRAMIRARAIARTLGLEMKLGDVEYQGDKRKATFYYTADGRVDFRELVRSYAREFKVKIEMRQIGSRQESARIGGLGSCGRELCCSTWLSDFKSVSTTAARYQNIAINQTKLSGQCGRLKCCLNYELDTYLDELSTFPKDIDVLRTKKSKANLVKMDIFKGLLYYVYDGIREPMVALDKERVREIKEMNLAGEIPDELRSLNFVEIKPETEEIEFADVTGQIELPNTKKRRKSRKRGKNQSRGRGPHKKTDKKEKTGGNHQNRNPQGKKQDNKQTKGDKSENKSSGNDKKRNSRYRGKNKKN